MKKVLSYSVFLLGFSLNGNCQTLHVQVPSVSKMVITEISYNPPEHGTDSLEYIELYNNDSVPADLENFHFSEGVQYTFHSFVAAPFSYIMVAKNAAAMMSTFGVWALEWTSGSLSNSGELIRLKDGYNITVDSVFYHVSAPWDPMANGLGPSLELCDAGADNAEGANWRHAIEFRAVNTDGDSIWGSPGQGCSYYPVADFNASDTVINEGEFVTFSDSSQGAPDSWLWIFEGGTPAEFSGENPPPVQYNSLGTYSVTLEVSNSIGNDTRIRNNYIEVGSIGIQKGIPRQEMIICPNPNDGWFLLVLKPWSGCEITIFSILGEVVERTVMKRESMPMDLSKHPSGVYFIRLSSKTHDQQLTGKILIR
jgi:PKD repeat protein